VGTVVRDKQVCHRCIAAKVDDAALRSVEAAVGVMIEPEPYQCGEALYLRICSLFRSVDFAEVFDLELQIFVK
jgi:hypothetical protein